MVLLSLQIVPGKELQEIELLILGLLMGGWEE